MRVLTLPSQIGLVKVVVLEEGAARDGVAHGVAATDHRVALAVSHHPLSNTHPTPFA